MILRVLSQPKKFYDSIKSTSGWHQSRQQLIIFSSSTVGMEELCPWVNYPREWICEFPWFWMRAEPLLQLLWQWEVVFANGCAGSCAHQDPSWDSLEDRDCVVTPQPAAFEAGIIGQLQKKHVVFIPILFRLPLKSAHANCSSVLKEWGTVLWSWQCCFTYRENRSNLLLK